jgi:hypothetical protein
MKGIIWLIVVIIDIVVILDIIRSNKDMEKKVLWIIAVLLLPILGPILYYVIGKK